MKTKPILIVVAVLIVAVCGFLFVRSKTVKTPEKAELVAFLKNFNSMLESGQAASALTFFEAGDNNKANKMLIKVLSGKTGLNGKSKALFKVTLDVENAEFDFTNPELTESRITVSFEHPKLGAAHSSLIFTIHKIGEQQYKIYNVKTTDFREEYAIYQNKVINATVPETDIYSPETLAAFKIAEQLKTRYDSILWFQHIDKKAWFYVIKGSLPDHFYWQVPDEKPEPINYKMGLINPELKEIIPVEYDLIHNIGGTIDSLIEVEKGDKKGLYNMAGTLVLPVTYDLILPLKEGDNLALLKNGNDYSYLKKDLTIGEKIADFKIADVLPNVKHFSDSYKLTNESYKNTMEYNDRNMSSSLVVSPSYMVEWQVLSKFMSFPNPLRKVGEEDSEDGEGTRSIDFTYNGSENKEENWFQTVFYSVVEDYLGGRGGLYGSKKVLVVDKKQNRVMGFDASTYFGDGEGGGVLTGECKQNSFRAINDSLFEYKITAELDQDLLDTTKYVQEGPYYYYLKLVNGKLVPLKTKRLFPTQFVKLDDSYFNDCYLITTLTQKYEDRTSKGISHATPDILQAMKNEIYASYKYKFKSARWNDVFQYRFNGVDTVLNANVDDSLTAIDKYNIDFINRKLKIVKPATVALR